MPHPTGHFDLILLDLHPPAAAVAELPARQVAVDRVPVEGQTGRQALDQACQSGAV